MTVANTVIESPLKLCPACGSHRTRVIGLIAEPRLVQLRCETCGRVYLSHDGLQARTGASSAL